MDKGLTVVIGMSIAYVASFLGMFLAYYSYKKHKKEKAAPPTDSEPES